jgi:hypothetical protein
MTYFDIEKGFVSETYSALETENAELKARVEGLEESWDEAAAALLRVRMEEPGWSILGQVSKTDGFSLRTLKELADKAEVQGVGNPLLKRAFELRLNPIFSRGFQVEGTIRPRYQKKLDNITVQELLFSSAGHETLERHCYNVGNIFLGYNRVTGDAMLIPFKEITNRAVDPDVPTRTAYYQRSWSRVDFDGKTENIIEWYPVVEWWAEGKADTVTEIANARVNSDWIVVDMRVNVPTSGHWGIPDVFPALPYAWAYSEYIRDAASLLKALNTIAWKVVGKSKAQAQAAGVALAGSRKTGGVAAMTAGTTLDSMPKAGQVDMADGMALAAMVASATGVPTPSLISVVQGGNAATIQSLDAPTVAMARARQERWVNFYRRVFIAMGIEGLTINFPKITEDPIHRQVASLATGRATGAIWADEYREAFLEAMSIKPTHTDAPDVEEYAQAQNALGFLNWMEQEVARAEAEADPLARQGNSGVAGRLGQSQEIDNSNRDGDARAGRGTQTDLTG